MSNSKKKKVSCKKHFITSADSESAASLKLLKITSRLRNLPVFSHRIIVTKEGKVVMFGGVKAEVESPASKTELMMT